MKIAFRCDASTAIGSGHVMRCLTLARALEGKGHSPFFITRDLSGRLGLTLLENAGVRTEVLPTGRALAAGAPRRLAHSHWLETTAEDDADATRAVLARERPDWLVVDNYALDREWERAAAPNARRLVIDDLYDRPHDADILLDQNLGDRARRYASLVSPDCRMLTGPRFALLRPDFLALRTDADVKDAVRRIVVFLGGSDPGNATGLALRALRRGATAGAGIDVVIGQGHPAPDEIRRTCETAGFSFHQGVPDFARFLSTADLVVGAAGSSTWERCCLGIPSITVSIAANQEPIGVEAQEAGVARHLGLAASLSEETLAHAIHDLAGDVDARRRMSRAGRALVDGRGADRVAEAMAS